MGQEQGKGKEESLSLEIDRTLVIIGLVVIIFLLMYALFSKATAPKQDTYARMISVADRYARQDPIKAGPITINGNMTVSQVRGMYLAYKDNPAFKRYTAELFTEVCGG